MREQKITILINALLLLVSIQYSFSQVTLTSSEKFHQTTGDVLVVSMPAFALASGFIWDDGQKGALQFTKSLVGTIAVTYGLKFIVEKERPNGVSTNSFPSGHTAVAFGSAAFIQKRYGWKYGIPAYALASYVGYSRIESNNHDEWDVIAGAILGVGMSYIFTKPYDPEKKLKLTSGLLENTPTFGVTYSFN